MDIDTLNNEALAPVAVEITTGRDPTTLDPNVRFYAVTSGGAGTQQVLDLPLLDLAVDEWANPQRVGSRIIIGLVNRVDPGDSVKITVNGQENNLAMVGGFVGGSLVFGSVKGGVVLNYPGATVAFDWLNDGWYINPMATDYDYDPGAGLLSPGFTVYAGVSETGQGVGAILKGGDSVTDGQSGGQVDIYGGNSTDEAAGWVQITGGDAVTTGAGGRARLTGGLSNHGQAGPAEVIGGHTTDGTPGDVVIQPGNNSDDTVHGRVFMFNLPTTNPSEPGQVWNNSGALAVGDPVAAGAVVEDFGVQSPWNRSQTLDAFAWVGVVFDLVSDCTVYAVGATLFARVVGWTYRSKLVVLDNATGAIVSVVASSNVSPAATTIAYAKMVLPLTAPATLTVLPAGQRYAIIFGVTNQTAVTPLKNAFVGDGMQFATAPFTVYGLVGFADVDPVAADVGAVTVATVTYGLGVVVGV